MSENSNKSDVVNFFNEDFIKFPTSLEVKFSRLLKKTFLFVLGGPLFICHPVHGLFGQNYHVDIDNLNLNIDKV